MQTVSWTGCSRSFKHLPRKMSGKKDMRMKKYTLKVDHINKSPMRIQ